MALDTTTRRRAIQYVFPLATGFDASSSKSLAWLVTEVLTRLGDTDQTVWSSAEIESYLKEGYDEMAYRTAAFWDTAYLDDVLSQATYTLPTDVYDVERATWNNRKIPALKARDLRQLDWNYLSASGQVEAYTIDQDGLRTLRKYRVPNGSKSIEVTSWGNPRDLSDLGHSETSQWGIARTIPEIKGPTQPWGIPRNFNLDTNNTRIEITRRGRKLTSINSEVEFDDRYIKYIRCFALARALERESPGQDKQLSEHYLSRYHDGIGRIVKRKARFRARPARRFGGGIRKRRRPRGPVLGPEFPVRTL